MKTARRPSSSVLPSVLALANYHYVRGGSERYALELARLLVARGHQVVEISTADARNSPAQGPARFVEPNDLERPGPLDLLRFHYSARAARAVKDVLAEHAIDVAHLHIYYGQLTSAVLGPLRRAGVPIVQTMHEYKPVCPVYRLVSGEAICEACDAGSYWHALPRRCNRGSLVRTLFSVSEAYLSHALGAVRSVDRFLASSEFQRAKLVEHGLPAERTLTLHNFVDVERHRPAAGPGEHVLYFGRLERLKGLWTLLAAAERVRELPFLIAGAGEAQAELARAIEERGLDHVKLLGFREGEELDELVRRSRCVVLPSEWYENCPLSLLETMALARASVASKIGGIPELVEDGATGLLFEPGDADALARALAWMIAHPRDAEAMGVQARERARTRFGPEQHYERLLGVYRSL